MFMPAAKGSARTPLGPIPKIVATFVYDSSQGQRTHFARTKIQMWLFTTPIYGHEYIILFLDRGIIFLNPHKPKITGIQNPNEICATLYYNLEMYEMSTNPCL